MPRDLNDPVLLVGAGPMAQAYARVLTDLGVTPTVVGRGEGSADRFAAEVGLRPETGGLDAWLARGQRPARRAVVAVTVGELHATTAALLDGGVERILVEKPAALDVDALAQLEDAAGRAGAEVSVAYNRRFLASTQEARRLIAEDGGVRSFTFDFTEIADRVGATSHPDHVKQAWLLANSTHVIDLAFHLGGAPSELHPLQAGSLPWHRAGARFSGAGSTASGALFSYLADWEAPGRWGVEVRTDHHRLQLRPLEQLWVQRHGSFEAEQVTLDDDLDRRFKPGLHRQVTAFLDPSDPHHGVLPDIASHHRFVREVVTPIATGAVEG
jgi:predicted dehydrogenase